MQKYLLIILINLLILTQLIASTRGDVKIVEASENIRYLSQKIAKEYLYLYYNPQKINLKNELSKNMEELEENINTIALNTQSEESKNILEFLTYNNEEIKLLLGGKATKDMSILLLDYSETFIEASNSIQSLHQYNFSEEEKMLMNIKELEYLLERVNKYYIASIMNLNRVSNISQIDKTIIAIDDILKIVNAYPYPNEVNKEKEKTLTVWEKDKQFLTDASQVSIPNLISISIDDFKQKLNGLKLYHKKNQ